MYIEKEVEKVNTIDAAHNAKRIAENEALAVAAELDEANALLALHRRFHEKAGCPGAEDCYVCATERVEVLRAREREMLRHGDPFSGDDWQAAQDLRAQIDSAMAELCARLREHFEASGHPVCPDPECEMGDGFNDHDAKCAYAAYVKAQDAAVAPARK